MAATRTSAKKRRLFALAHREAGHAVLAWWVGQKFKYVTIVQDDDALGHVEFKEHPKWFTDAVSAGLSAVGEYHTKGEELEIAARIFIEREIVHLFAGQHAEARFRRRHPHPVIQPDNWRAIELARLLNVPVDEYLGNYWGVSEELVERLWPQIQHLAAALIEQETLDYDAAIKVVTQTKSEKTAAASPV
jgi:hypothetical protein